MSEAWIAPLLSLLGVIGVAFIGYQTTKNSTKSGNETKLAELAEQAQARHEKAVQDLIDDLKEEIKGARAEAAEARSEARAARTEAREANTQNDILRGQMAAVERQLSIEKAANERLVGVNLEQAEELTSLRARVAKLERQV